jgi:hypothetical protein
VAEEEDEVAAEEVAEEESTTGISTAVVAVDGEDEVVTRPTGPSAVAVAAVARLRPKRLMQKFHVLVTR